jgi:hypothetical protein
MRCFITGYKQSVGKTSSRRGKTRQTIKDRLAKQNSELRRKRKLTSSKEGVEELPATIA